jgi:hypothetical protein
MGSHICLQLWTDPHGGLKNIAAADCAATFVDGWVALRCATNVNIRQGVQFTSSFWAAVMSHKAEAYNSFPPTGQWGRRMFSLPPKGFLASVPGRH